MKRFACAFAVSATLSAGSWSIQLADLVAQSAPLTLVTLSSRADMVTGGDALVELRGAGTSTGGVSIAVDGRDVTPDFAPDAARGALTGVVTGLRVGANTIEARAGGRTARLAVTNFPVTGPCSPVPIWTRSSAGPRSRASVRHSTRTARRQRRSSTATARRAPPAPAPPGATGAAARPADPFKPWPAAGAPRPTDIAETTTSDGRRVPYVVRIESGTINRSIYRIAILDDPASERRTRRPGARAPPGIGG